MKNIVVLGIGNKLMMDDGIGIYIVEEFVRVNKFDNIDFIVGETDIDFCISIIKNYSRFIIIDAVLLNKNPGTVSVLSFANIDNISMGLSQHNMHLFNYIKHYNCKGLLIGIEPYELNFHLGLSNFMTEMFKDIFCQVKDIIIS